MPYQPATPIFYFLLTLGDLPPILDPGPWLVLGSPRLWKLGKWMGIIVRSNILIGSYLLSSSSSSSIGSFFWRLFLVFLHWFLLLGLENSWISWTVLIRAWHEKVTLRIELLDDQNSPRRRHISSLASWDGLTSCRRRRASCRRWTSCRDEVGNILWGIFQYIGSRND